VTAGPPARPGGRTVRSVLRAPLDEAVSDPGVASNSRLTGAAGAVLLVLLAAEGVTILGVRQHLSLHVFLGMLLVPPVLVKIGSTTWRFARYYSGAPAYRRKGPPHVILRLLGPLVVVLTVVLFASGIVLVLAPNALGGSMLFAHKASFVLWFGAMTIHVLGHIGETARLAPLDLARRTRSQVRGASARQWLLLASLVAGVLLGVVMLGPTTHYLAQHAFPRRLDH
jgi:hypothetical protein